MKKFFQRTAISFITLVSLFSPLAVHAQGQFSILPYTSETTSCQGNMDLFESSVDQTAQLKENRDIILGCAIRTGRISLVMVPFFITYVANFLLGLSGIISVLFIVIGGYHYVIGGLTEEKEKGKQTIMHALMGMGVALLSWTIVTVIMNAVTG
jgi:hypothetical protein